MNNPKGHGFFFTAWSTTKAKTKYTVYRPTSDAHLSLYMLIAWGHKIDHKLSKTSQQKRPINFTV
jgi:hypothetical protein